MQLVTSVADLASDILKKIFKLYPIEKLKQQIKSFRVTPTIALDSITNALDISFLVTVNVKPLLEDVLNLIESLSKKDKRPIVVFDEFQEIREIDKNLYKILRSILQLQTGVNYIFMGSQESLMRDIFERKKSLFYHFGTLQTLDVIPQNDFSLF